MIGHAAGAPRMIRLLGAAALMATFPISWALRDVLSRDLMPVCIFRIATGKPCPLCGMTRAFAHATHGDLRAANAMNPLWWLAAMVILVFAAALIADGIAGGDRSGTIVGFFQRHWRYFAVALGFFWLARITL